MKKLLFGTTLLLLFSVSGPARADLSPADPAQSSNRIILADAGRYVGKKSQSCSKIEIFVTSWCGYCKMMESFLTQKGVPYTKYDIEADDDAARTYRKLGGRGVPLVKVGSRIVYGYDPDTVLSYAKCR